MTPVVSSIPNTLRILSNWPRSTIRHWDNKDYNNNEGEKNEININKFIILFFISFFLQKRITIFFIYKNKQEKRRTKRMTVKRRRRYPQHREIPRNLWLLLLFAIMFWWFFSWSIYHRAGWTCTTAHTVKHLFGHCTCMWLSCFRQPINKKKSFDESKKKMEKIKWSISRWRRQNINKSEEEAVRQTHGISSIE